jgi:long-chain acyl-CoA synthetase
MEPFSDNLDKFFDSLRNYAQKDAICQFILNGEPVHCTFQQLADRSESFARGLNGNNSSGKIIGLIAKPSIDAIVAVLGIIRSGAVLLPIDQQIDDASLIHILTDSSPQMLLVDSDAQSRLQKLSAMHVEPVALSKALSTYSGNTGTLPHLSSDNNSILFYTSGTTGPPKGVPLTNRNIAFELESVRIAQLTKNTDRLLLPLPLHHVYPLVIGILVPLNLGLTIVLPSSLTGPRLLQAINQGKVTVIIGVPRLYSAIYSGIIQKLKEQGKTIGTIYELLIGLLTLLRRFTGISIGKLILFSLHKQTGTHLRIMASGGAALDRNLFLRLEALGWKVAVGYGLTETSPLLTLSGPGKSRPGSAGKRLRGVSLRIDTRAAPVGSKKGLGEVLAKGPNVFSGYRNLPGKTSEVFTNDGWFRTGDLGYFGTHEYLYLTDRISTMIVTESGENIQPEAVEAVYEQHHFIKETGVLQYEGKLVALIVPQTESIAAEGFAVHDGVRVAIEEQNRILPSYKRITGYLVTFQEIPRTLLGKIQRHHLVDLYKKKQSEANVKRDEKPLSIDEMSSADRDLFLNPAAREAWSILAERFKNHQLTLDSLPMADLGIDSLAWFELTLEIQDRTGVEIDDRVIAEITTIRDLISQIIDRAPNATVKPGPFEKPEKELTPGQLKWLAPLSLSQRIFRFILYYVNLLINHVYFRLTVNGLENLQSAGQCIITPNHLSYLDPFVLAAAIPYPLLSRTSWAAGVEVAFRNPLNRFFSRLGGAVPIEHGMGTRSDMSLVTAILDKKKNIVWFPEGRRSPGKEFLPFRGGIGLLLQKRPVSVVPVIIEGTDKALSIGSFILRPVHVRITFGKPLATSELTGTSDENEGSKSQKVVETLRKVMEKFRDQVTGQ